MVSRVAAGGGGHGGHGHGGGDVHVLPVEALEHGRHGLLRRRSRRRPLALHVEPELELHFVLELLLALGRLNEEVGGRDGVPVLGQPHEVPLPRRPRLRRQLLRPPEGLVQRTARLLLVPEVVQSVRVVVHRRHGRRQRFGRLLRRHLLGRDGRGGGLRLPLRPRGLVALEGVLAVALLAVLLRQGGVLPRLLLLRHPLPLQSALFQDLFDRLPGVVL
mmetsp:Transcript_70817/g.160197  ORF Transcript_70817/g.160197 Transcript_70817/m.160197 type:complete len:218 (+) Transcript_70817:603-1256(+)